jgi:hypothetical protein
MNLFLAPGEGDVVPEASEAATAKASPDPGFRLPNF